MAKIVHRATGASDADAFLADAKVTFDPSKQLGAMEQRYAQGDRNVDFLLDYAKAKMSTMNQKAVFDIVKEFVDYAPKEDLINEKAFALMGMLRGASVIEYGSEQYYHIMDNREKLIAMPSVGDRTYFSVISGAQVNYLTKRAAEVSSIEELDKEIAEATTGLDYGQNYERLQNDMHGNYYIGKKEFDTWYVAKKQQFKEMEARMTQNAGGGTSRNMGNMSARMMGRMFQQITGDPRFDEADASFLKKVVNDCQAMMDKDPENLGGYYSLAALYVKVKDKANAQKTFDAYAGKLKEKGYWKPDSPNHAMIEQLQKSIEAL